MTCDYMGMAEVSEGEFNSFLSGKEFVREQGFWFHSTIYKINGEAVAYMETSSYGAPTEYRVKNGTMNFPTINLVGEIIKSKEKNG